MISFWPFRRLVLPTVQELGGVFTNFAIFLEHNLLLRPLQLEMNASTVELTTVGGTHALYEKEFPAGLFPSNLSSQYAVRFVCAGRGTGDAEKTISIELSGIVLHSRTVAGLTDWCVEGWLVFDPANSLFKAVSLMAVSPNHEDYNSPVSQSQIVSDTFDPAATKTFAVNGAIAGNALYLDLVFMQVVKYIPEFVSLS